MHVPYVVFIFHTGDSQGIRPNKAVGHFSLNEAKKGVGIHVTILIIFAW